MRRGRSGVMIIAALGLGALVSGPAAAAPQLRAQIVQRGDFVLFGNTLAHDCSPATPLPLVGTIGNCGGQLVDSAADVLWRADSPTAGTAVADLNLDAGEARSAAALLLPPGAVATHAFLYWSAQLAIAGPGDPSVRIERPGFLDIELVADACYASADGSYVCVADVSELVLLYGPGLYRIGGVDVRPFGGLVDEEVFAAWWMVVLFERSGDPLRSIGVFESLDPVLPLAPLDTVLPGFIVPAIGVQGSLGVVALAGDHAVVGDQLRVADVPLGNELNPIDNFFNGTRTAFGFPVTVAGDLPRLSGLPASTSGLDLDIVDISPLLHPAQTSLPFGALTLADTFLLATTVVSVTTASPLLEVVVTVVDLDGGAFIPGDVVEYEISVTNVGTDVAIDVVLTDVLPPEVAFLPNSLEIVDGPGFGVLSDVDGDDLGECIDNVVVVRLGTFADAFVGGQLLPDESTTVRFQAVIDLDAVGVVANQPTVVAAGLLGAPLTTVLADGNGGEPGVPPVEFLVEECDEFTACPEELPLCHLAAVPNVCVECLDDLDCSELEFCEPLSKTCECVVVSVEICDGVDNDCNDIVDDGFDVGAPCSVGLGECAEDGALVCDELGAAVCDAVPGMPQPELCDGLDNDCDGVIDGVCGTCLIDVECGAPFLVCDGGTCIVGCRGLGEPCPPGFECSSIDATIGECVVPEEEEEEKEVEVEDKNLGDLLGCGCTGRPLTGREAPWLLALVALARRRPRRRVKSP